MLSKSPKVTQQVVEPGLEAFSKAHFLSFILLPVNYVCTLDSWVQGVGVENNSHSRIQSESNGGWAQVLENFKAPPDDWGVQHGLGTLMYSRLQPGR